MTEPGLICTSLHHFMIYSIHEDIIQYILISSSFLRCCKFSRYTVLQFKNESKYLSKLLPSFVRSHRNLLQNKTVCLLFIWFLFEFLDCFILDRTVFRCLSIHVMYLLISRSSLKFIIIDVSVSNIVDITV